MATSTNMPGGKVPRGAYSAFVPAPLPPKFSWTLPLVRALSDADRLIGKLAGEGGRLPNPHVLMRPFVRREAVLSSKIEGTQATLGELLASEAGAAVERSPEDLREVGNYVVALEHGIARLKDLPLCVRIIRELHEKLMEGVRGEQATPGRFRKIQNWIGRPGSTLASLLAWQRKVAGDSTNTPLRVVELLASNPYITTKGAAEKLGVAFTTALRAIERLEQLGIVKQTGAAKRDRVWCAKELLDILEEPAHLKPSPDS